MSYRYTFSYPSLSRRRHIRYGVNIISAMPALVILAFVLLRPHTALAPLAIISQPKIAGKKEDVLTEQDWQHFAGASQDAAGVHIHALGRMIVNQDGSGGRPNPPVNVRGPQLDVDGNFRVSAELSGVSERWAALQLYSEVPVIYDEWRYEPPSIQLKLTSKLLTISLWDGNSEDPVTEKKIAGRYSSNTRMSIEHSGEKLLILVNDKKVASLADNVIFESGHVWFGTDAEVGHGGWTLRTLTAEPLAGGTLEVRAAPKLSTAHDDKEALRNLSLLTSRKLPIGAAISLYPLMSDSNYRELAAGQFSMLTPENAMKAQFIHPGKDIYEFAEADSLVDFAKVNDMRVYGHALVFGEANPRWMQETPKDQRKQMMIDHITTIVSRYKGRVASWDVVNEPLADNNESDEVSSDIRNHLWYEAMGEDYIEIAFRAARAADPAAKLYINEWGVEEESDRWDSLLSLLTRLKAKGVPVDGVGFQAHVYEESDEINPGILSRHIRQLATLGIEAQISELDVTGVDASWQAGQYASTLETCLSEPNCKSFGIWGVGDMYGSTTKQYSYPPEPGDNLLWDVDYQHKAAYRLAQQVLKNF